MKGSKRLAKGSNPQDTAGLVAGLVDTGLASLATFAVGLAATRLLTAGELGAYAIFFSAFVLATTIPTNLILVPIEIRLVGEERGVRLGWVGRSLRWGLAGAVVSILPYGLLVPLAGGSDVTDSVLVALWVTGSCAGLLSPLQDHLRRVFHLAGRGSHAAATSLAQLAGVLLALAGLRAAGVDAAWIPLGALTAANLFSLLVAVTLSRPGPEAARPEGNLRLIPVLRSGRWLLVQGVVPIGAGFAANAIVGGIAGLAILGRAEAARIVAQPLFVLGGGISASLGPRSMESGAGADRPRAVRIRRSYWALLVPIGMLYLAVVSWNVSLNPMQALVPVAYETRGLVLIAGVGALLVGMSLPARSELLGLRAEKGLTRIDAASSVARVGVASATAAALGAFSIHLGTVVDGSVKMLTRTRLANRRFRDHHTRRPE